MKPQKYNPAQKKLQIYKFDTPNTVQVFTLINNKIIDHEGVLRLKRTLIIALSAQFKMPSRND